MAIQKIRSGSRIGINDPLCQLKTEADLLNHEYNPREPRSTEAGRWFENRIKTELYNNCKEKDPNRAQQDDGYTSESWPVRDDPPKPRHGGPVWTDKKAI